MFEVILTNIGNKIYEGKCEEAAIAAARLTGFEATLLKDGEFFASFSPVTGWKRPVSFIARLAQR